VVVVVYGVANIVKAQDPDASEWAAGHYGAWTLIVTGGLATCGYFLVAFGYNRRLKTEESEAALYKTCRSLARVVAQATGIDQDRVGVHVWAVAGPPVLTHLVRRVKYLSVVVERPESGVTWRRGRGALGICWIEREQKVWDLDDLQRRATSKGDFCEALSSYERMGLRWSDFQNAKHFTAVWVQPIFKPRRGNRVAGCLSVDIVGVPGAGEQLQEMVQTKEIDLLSFRSVLQAQLR
jgi:hypothetical protein